MKKRASLFLGTSLVLITAAAVDARAQTPPPGYEPPPGYQPQQQYPQQQYPQQQYPQQQYPQQQYPQQQYPQQQYPQQQPAPGYAPAPVPAPMRRMGFFGGLSLGGGAMATVSAGTDQGESVGGLAYSAHIGFMLAPRFGLLIEGSGISGSFDSIDGTIVQSHTMGLIGAQLFLNDWIWARGGIGGGTLSFSGDSYGYEEYTGASVMLAAGVEFLKAGGVSMDVHGRWAYTAFDGFGVSNLALQVGLNWYSVVF